MLAVIVFRDASSPDRSAFSGSVEVVVLISARTAFWDESVVDMAPREASRGERSTFS